MMSEEALEIGVNLAAKKFAENPIAVAMETNNKEYSHLLLTTRIPAGPTRDILALRVSTRHLSHIVNKAISSIDAADQISFYFKASDYPFSQGAFGHVFEKFFYVWLSSNPNNELLCTPALPSRSAKSRSELEQLRIRPVGLENVIVHGGEASTKGYGTANQHEIPCGWIPASRSDATFDAVILTDAEIVTIQVTVAAEHSMKDKGFQKLEDNLLPTIKKNRSWHHVFVTDQTETASKLRRKKYPVAEKREIQVHTAVLKISSFKLSTEDFNRAMAPSVSRHELLYIHSGTNQSHQGESVGVDDIEMEIDAEGEEQVGVEYLFLSTGGTRLTKSGR